MLTFLVPKSKRIIVLVIWLDTLQNMTVKSFDFALSCRAFGALTLLVGHQEEHPTCKRLSDEVLGRWRCYLCEAGCR